MPESEIQETYFQQNQHPASDDDIKMQGTRTQQHEGCALEATPCSTDSLWPEHCAVMCTRGVFLRISRLNLQLAGPAAFAGKSSARPVGHSRRKKLMVVCHPNTLWNTSPRMPFNSKLFTVDGACGAPYSLLTETRRNAARWLLASQLLLKTGGQLAAGGFAGAATPWGYRPRSWQALGKQQLGAACCGGRARSGIPTFTIAAS